MTSVEVREPPDVQTPGIESRASVHSTVEPGSTTGVAGVIDGLRERVSSLETNSVRCSMVQCHLQGVIRRLAAGLVETKAVSNYALKRSAELSIVWSIPRDELAGDGVGDGMVRARNPRLVDVRFTEQA